MSTNVEYGRWPKMRMAIVTWGGGPGNGVGGSWAGSDVVANGFGVASF